MTEVTAEFGAFLDDFLPADYQENYQAYRSDRTLRVEYQAAAFDAGWLAPDWEPGLGGRGLSEIDALAVRLAGAQRRVPRYLNIQGAGVVAPAIRAFGTDRQQADHLRPTLRGDEWWALGMSEPNAGSDLASLRTSAVPANGGFLISGQKVWTTQADEARWCSLYARTDPEARPHRGISCFIVDLRAPGIEVRPIRTASPAIEMFCEVFLDEVWVPESALLGPRGGGWSVALSSLEHERDMIWVNTWLETRRALEPVLEAPGLSSDLFEELGRRLGDAEALRLVGLRAAAARWAGQQGNLYSALKLLGSESVQRAARFAVTAAGADSLDRQEIFDDRMESLSATIYGGTSEIQRNIIAERSLGLPKG